MNDAWLQKLNSGSPLHGAAETGMEITASRDLSCLNRLKYIYQFAAPIEETIIRGFSDCDIRNFRFSAFMPSAKDLIRVTNLGKFQVDFIIGGDRAFVYFIGDYEHPPLAYLDDFNKCLHCAGLGRVRYVTGVRPRCDRCPVKHLKNCSVSEDQAPSLEAHRAFF